MPLPICLRDELIGGRRQPHFDAGLRAVVRVHAGQPRRRRARVIARAVAERVGLQVREAAQDVDVLLRRPRAASGIGVSSNPAPVVFGVH